MAIGSLLIYDQGPKRIWQCSLFGIYYKNVTYVSLIDTWDHGGKTDWQYLMSAPSVPVAVRPSRDVPLPNRSLLPVTFRDEINFISHQCSKKRISYLKSLTLHLKNELFQTQIGNLFRISHFLISWAGIETTILFYFTKFVVPFISSHNSSNIYENIICVFASKCIFNLWFPGSSSTIHHHIKTKWRH